ncbi:MAG: FkbM family methyltransferase, partial [Pseudomonadota bacterium]
MGGKMKAIYALYAILFARPAFFRFNQVVYNLGLRGLGVLNWQTEHLRGERDLLRSLLAKVSPGDVVIDVGANEGDFSAMVLELARDAKVYAVEPHPKTFARLRQRLGQSATCLNVALASSPGIAKLFDYSGRDGSSHASLHKSAITDLHKSAVTDVEVVVETLGNPTRSNGITEVFLLKIDAEGAEREILRGAAQELESGALRIKYLHIEFNEM